MAALQSPVTSPTGPREEAVLETFFQALGTLAFDKAKELMDWEKETNKGWSPATLWGGMVHCLTNIITLERQYLALAFITPKRFKPFSLKGKETHQATYDSIVKELQCLEDAAPRSRDVTPTSPLPSLSSDFDVLIAHLGGQLGHFLIARKKMISLYS